MVDRFTRTRFGAFLTTLIGGVFTKPSRQNFLTLALGWTFALGRHTIATYLWRAGATALKHFTRYYVFFGVPFYGSQDRLFRRVIRLAERHVPEGEPIRVIFDETTCKKSGRKIEGASNYRNGAGTARQEWRTLYGVNFVIGILQIRLQPWPDRFLSIPIGLRLYVKKKEAAHLGRPYHSRSGLARQMLELVSETVGPGRTVVTIQDGNRSTKKFLRGLPKNVEVVGRLPIDSKLYEAPEEPPPGRRGRRPRKGSLIGSAKTLLAEENPAEENPAEENPAEKGSLGEDNSSEESAWQSHPTEEGVWVRRVRGIWDSVLPKVMLDAVVVYRPDLDSDSSKKGSSKKELEAFFTTLSEEPSLLGGPAETTAETTDEAEADSEEEAPEEEAPEEEAPEEEAPEEEAPEEEAPEEEDLESDREEAVSERVLHAYGGRWAVETFIRTAKQHFGLGKDQCRRWRRIEGANAFRMFMAAAQGLFFADQAVEKGAIDLTRWRPWYRQKRNPSGEDVLWACREELLRQGIIPTVGFEQGVGKIPRERSEALARAS